MKCIFKTLLAISFIFAWGTFEHEAKAQGIEPTISVKLVNYLGDKSSITIQPSKTYKIEGSNVELESGKTYSVKVESTGVGIYEEDQRIASADSFKVTPSTYSATLSINGRKYLGDMRFINEGNKYIRPINTLPLEDYLKGVVPKEAYADWHMDALKAQALAARTYALTYINSNAIDDTQYKQVYGGYDWNERTSQAVDETFGETVKYNGALAQTVFSSSNGGYIESSLNYWGSTQLPYLESKPDPYDPQREWTKVVNKQQINLVDKDLKDSNAWWNSINEVDSIMAHNIKQKMNANGFSGKDIKIVSVEDVKFYAPTTGQRATRGDLVVKYIVKDELDSNGNIKVSTWNLIGEKASSVKSLINGTSMLNLYVKSITSDSNSIVIKGAGYGHGVGLSQYGASVMASQGNSYTTILEFYYPGTTISQQYTDAYPRIEVQPPSAPTIMEVTDETTIVRGRAEAGSLVYVKKGTEVIGRGVTESTGIYRVSIAKQPAKTKIGVVVKGEGGYSPYSYTVVTATAKAEAPKAPTIMEVTDETTIVRGRAEAGSLVYVKKGTEVIGRGVTESTGIYRVRIAIQPAKTKIGVVVKGEGGYSPYSYTVVTATAKAEAPKAPTIMEVTDETTIVRGRAEAGSLVYVKKGTEVIGRGVTESTGIYRVRIAKQPAKTKIGVVVKGEGGYSPYSYTVVTATAKAEVPKAPTIMEVTDETTIVRGRAEAGSLVYVKKGSEVIGRGTTGSDGIYRVRITKQPINTRIGIIVKGEGGYSPYTYITVKKA
ncbi:SpoIID/LytB domain-containing protein [Priestia flexa]|uniref:SpoIID/LytB domain-containing protein n=1 Tax=Priestia flexa TaxID=86664 RepID=UPI001B33EAC6|nr:SpoIID/LytB domain-containing protein [Priestia flexa]